MLGGCSGGGARPSATVCGCALCLGTSHTYDYCFLLFFTVFNTLVYQYALTPLPPSHTQMQQAATGPSRGSQPNQPRSGVEEPGCGACGRRRWRWVEQLRQHRGRAAQQAVRREGGSNLGHGNSFVCERESEARPLTRRCHVVLGPAYTNAHHHTTTIIHS